MTRQPALPASELVPGCRVAVNAERVWWTVHGPPEKGDTSRVTVKVPALGLLPTFMTSNDQ
jgi:hypothetical protein